jgi:hypothetical protein
MEHTSRGGILLLQRGGIVSRVTQFSLAIYKNGRARWLSWFSKIRSDGFCFEE